MALLEHSRRLPDKSQDPKRGQDIISGIDHDCLVLRQVRAFLEASEEVDLDEETWKDLIQAVNQDLDDDPSRSAAHQDLNTEDHFDSDAAGEELDISALYNIEDEGNGSGSFRLLSKISTLVSSARNVDSARSQADDALPEGARFAACTLLVRHAVD